MDGSDPPALDIGAAGALAQRFADRILRPPSSGRLAVLTVLTLAGVPASAQSGRTGNYCAVDMGGNSCTASDVRIEGMTVVSLVEDCGSGVPGEAEVVFDVLLAGGAADRYDLGLYVALDGGSAYDGDTCYQDYLDPPLEYAPLYGDFNTDGIPDIHNGPWFAGEIDGDACGDLEGALGGTQAIKTVKGSAIGLRFQCVDTTGDGNVDIDVCTSWSTTAASDCSSIVDIAPGSAARCSCRTQQGLPRFEVLGLHPGGVTVTPTSGLFTSEAGGQASFTVVLTSAPASNVVVALESSLPAEGTVLPAELIFTPANWDEQQTATVTGVDDTAADGDIAYMIQTAITSTGYASAEPEDVSVTNLDGEGRFYPLPPCRVLDTRLTAPPPPPLGGPALVANQVRTFTVTGLCGIPANARAISINATATSATGLGEVVLYRSDLAPVPGTSNVSFKVTDPRAANGVVQLTLDGTGAFSARALVADAGTVHLIVDVNGYFE